MNAEQKEKILTECREMMSKARYAESKTEQFCNTVSEILQEIIDHPDESRKAPDLPNTCMHKQAVSIIYLRQKRPKFSTECAFAIEIIVAKEHNDLELRTFSSKVRGEKDD